MKKILYCIAGVVLTFSLAACKTAAVSPEMRIEKARLTEQEKAMAQLLGADEGGLIYDFWLDETVKSVQINTYELIDGTWTLVSGGGGQAFSDRKGRAALAFENLALGMRAALQSQNSSGATEYTVDTAEDFTGMSRSTSTRSEPSEIIYEREIPLAIQIITSQSTVSSYDVEYFFKPEAYANHGYEHVYAVTIRFSQQSVGEPEAPDEGA